MVHIAIEAEKKIIKDRLFGTRILAIAKVSAARSAMVQQNGGFVMGNNTALDTAGAMQTSGKIETSASQWTRKE